MRKGDLFVLKKDDADELCEGLTAEEICIGAAAESFEKSGLVLSRFIRAYESRDIEELKNALCLYRLTYFSEDSAPLFLKAINSEDYLLTVSGESGIPVARLLDEVVTLYSEDERLRDDIVIIRIGTGNYAINRTIAALTKAYLEDIAEDRGVPLRITAEVDESALFEGRIPLSELPVIRRKRMYASPPIAYEVVDAPYLERIGSSRYGLFLLLIAHAVLGFMTGALLAIFINRVCALQRK